MGNKIEKIVRFYVKKYLTEAADDLEALVERKVRERMSLASLLKENEAPAPSIKEASSPEISPPKQRKRLRPEDLGITEGVWKGVYEGIDVDNPILTGVRDQDGVPVAGEEKPEHVPEAVLEQAGLLRDFSKHVEAMEKKDRQKSGDNDLEQKRQEILRRTMG